MSSSATKLISSNQSLVTNPIGASNLAPTTTTSPKNVTQDSLIKRIALTIFAYVKAAFQLALAIGLYPIYLFNRARHIITSYPRATQLQGSNSTVTAQQITPPKIPPIQKATVLKNDAPQQTSSLIPQERPSSTPQLTPAQAATTVKNAPIENTEGSLPNPLSGKIVNPLNITIASTALATFLYFALQEAAQDSTNPIYVHEELSLLDNTTTYPLVGQLALFSDSKVNDGYPNPYYANSTSGLQSFDTPLNNISNSQNMSLFGGVILVASIVGLAIYKLWGTKIIKETDHSPESGNGVEECEDNRDRAQPPPDKRLTTEEINRRFQEALLRNAKEQPISQDQSLPKETLEEQHSAISQIEGEEPIITPRVSTDPSNSPCIPEKPSVNTQQSIPQNQDQNSPPTQIEKTEILSRTDRTVKFLLPKKQWIETAASKSTKILSRTDRTISFLLPEITKKHPHISEEQIIPHEDQNSSSQEEARLIEQVDELSNGQELPCSLPLHASQEDEELEQLLENLQNN